MWVSSVVVYALSYWLRVAFVVGERRFLCMAGTLINNDKEREPDNNLAAIEHLQALH
jgi:hypothetical protein